MWNGISHSHDNPLESFRQVLARRIACDRRDPELELGFNRRSAFGRGQVGQGADAGRTLQRRVAEARGLARFGRSQAQHQNPALHAGEAPGDEVARSVFDAAEQARVEALGARGMEGHTLQSSPGPEMRMRTDPITRAETATRCRGDRGRSDGSRAPERRGAARRWCARG